jgi:hypothetical protein
MSVVALKYEPLTPLHSLSLCGVSPAQILFREFSQARKDSEVATENIFAVFAKLACLFGDHKRRRIIVARACHQLRLMWCTLLHQELKRTPISLNDPAAIASQLSEFNPWLRAEFIMYSH